MAELDSDAGEKTGQGQINTIANHLWTPNDTFASVAEKYYGSSKNWRYIYDYNRAVIGDNPNSIKVGMVIMIPELPDELK